jgi:hypothetical protein
MAPEAKPALVDEKIMSEEVESSDGVQKGDGSDVERYVAGRANFSEAEQKRILYATAYHFI